MRNSYENHDELDVRHDLAGSYGAPSHEFQGGIANVGGSMPQVSACGAAAGTVVGLSKPESDRDAVHLDVMKRCFWASVDDVGRQVGQ